MNLRHRLNTLEKRLRLAIDTPAKRGYAVLECDPLDPAAVRLVWVSDPPASQLPADVEGEDPGPIIVKVLCGVSMDDL